MKTKFRCLCITLITAWAGMAMADDPIHALLFPPELLIQHRAQIGLTDQQVEQIRGRLEEAGPKVQEHQIRLNKAMGRLAELLSAEKVDEDTTLKQLDEVLAIEKHLKTAHLRIMIQIRNELTAQQRQVATQIRRTSQSNEGLEQRLKAKLARIEQEVQARAQAGQPPFDAVGLMQKFPELMQNGQVNEAEALLDRVIAILGLEKGDDAEKQRNLAGPPEKLAKKIRQIQQRAQQMAQSGEDVSEIQGLMKKLGPLIQQGNIEDAEKLIDQALELTGQEADAATDDETSQRKADTEARLSPKAGFLKRYSLAAMRDEIAALEKEDVAWRKIAWKTCLLDGLQASRAQNKPIMLWIFIDRPIDDERC